MPRPEAPGSEFRLIDDYLGGLDEGAGVVLGGGDDAAVLSLDAGCELVVSTDNAAEGVHFPVGADSALAVYRAVAAAVSDLAAMGATPLAMTLNLSLPAPDPAWLAGCRRGLSRAVDHFSLPLVGGDLSRGALIFGVQVMGSVPAGGALLRSGARPGHRVCVSGCLGDAAAGLALLQGRVTAAEKQRRRFLAAFWEPVPRLELGQQLRGRASAAIDVSDGLLADAGHIARRSGVAITIESARVPLSPELIECAGRDRALEWALAGGEDYALCFTLPVDVALPEGCVCVGTVSAGEGIQCDVMPENPGYRHFP